MSATVLTMPSRRFLVQQATLDAIKIYRRTDMAWATPAQRLEVFSTPTFVRTDLVELIRACFRDLVSRYQPDEEFPRGKVLG